VPKAAQHNASGDVLYEDIWYCQNIKGGTETVTVNYTNTVYYHYVYLSEFSGVATTSPVDFGFGYNINPSTNPTYSLKNFYIPTSGNTSRSGDLIYSLIYPDNAFSTITPGNHGLNSGGNDEYQVASAVGPYMNTWTTASAGTSVVMGLAAFKSASGTPGTISNTAAPGAFMSYSCSGTPPTCDTEQVQENFENWLGIGSYNGYAADYGGYAFQCSGSDTNCIDNPYLYTWEYPAARTKLIMSLALTGCDTTANLSGSTLCVTGHTIPLVGSGSIASGAEDSAFQNIFQLIVNQYGTAPIIRLGWEMNLPGTDWTWAVGGSGGSTSTNGVYVAAFQHVAQIAHSYGLKVDWCPNWGSQTGPADAFYPGDAYVDEIGMDLYDTDNQEYPYYAGDNGTSVAPLYGLYWLEAFASLHGKPIAFPEVGVAGSDSTDAHGANIINGLAALASSEKVNYLLSWQSWSGDSIFYPFCDNGTVGFCGSPYAAPLTEAAFCTKFGKPGNTCH
jgi:hypothetical protein